MDAVRNSWTDERLDEFSKRIDERFDRVDLRFEDVDRRFDKVDASLATIVDQFQRLQQTMIQVGGGLIGVLIIAVITLIATRI